MTTQAQQQRTVTAHDPCPECGGFDSAYWVDSGPGYDSWSCKCSAQWVIIIEEPNRSRAL